MSNHKVLISAYSLVCLLLSGCGSLLPHATQTNDLPWSSYEQAQQAFESITPEKTTLADLHMLGIRPESTPNVLLLNHADVVRRLAVTSNIDMLLLAPPVQRCLAALASCHAYEIEQKHINRQRHGNFLMDFLNFRRQTNISGWQFNALIIMQDDLVAYKLWGGKPHFLQQEEERTPLGPLQGLGSSILQR